MKTLLLFVLTGLSVLCFAQPPVKWEYNAKKIADRTYEVHLTAIIENGWHTFSQAQPKEAIALPTKISFNKNPLLQLKGKAKEVGVMEKYKEKTLGIEQWQYANKVDFVQVIELRVMGYGLRENGGHKSQEVGGQVKTNATGTITYQTCNDHECLPPKTITFSVPVGN